MGLDIVLRWLTLRLMGPLNLHGCGLGASLVRNSSDLAVVAVIVEVGRCGCRSLVVLAVLAVPVQWSWWC